MLEQLHLASQYLAAAGKSFVEHKSDDSHTNLGFDPQNNQFETWQLNDSGLKLALSLNDFSLRWIGTSENDIHLEGKTHGEIVSLLQVAFRQLGFKDAYAFDLHYELPFSFDDGYQFASNDKKSLVRLSQLRKLADSSLSTFLNTEGLQSNIRIWPHHLDTGAFVTLEGSEKSVGMGMAIPDSMVDDHYFYMSGYRGHDGIDTSIFEKLSLGEWKNDGFKGAVLAASDANEERVVQFLQETFSSYKT